MARRQSREAAVFREGRGVGPFDPARAHAYPAGIGVDEVGRGALCGPVVVAAVWFDPAAIPPDLLGALDDSKRLSPRRREAAAAGLSDCARIALAAAPVAEIDRIGIRGATLAAMARSVMRLGLDGPIWIDGRETPSALAQEAVAVIRGESVSPQIAAASIVAKVARDRLMHRLAARHPDYGWDTNVGYGSAAHLAGVLRIGASRHHRRSFAPVAEAIAARR
jgi:ribonuclease HII